MSSQLGPIDVFCDAPPYTIVRACHRLGLREPEDVRWCRPSELPPRTHTWRDLLWRPWRLLHGRPPGQERTCTCGAPLPLMERFTFTLRSGQKVDYLLGQCRRCRTIFWEQASPLRPAETGG
jgi:hypothetical protein